MLTSIRLQNFKGHRDTTVHLGRFTVLVGPNGAGKTSVLQALRTVTWLMDTEPQKVFSNERHPDDLLHRGALGPMVLGLEGREGDIPWRISVEIPVSTEPDADKRPTLAWSYGSDSGQQQEDGRPLSKYVPSALKDSLGAAVLYRFDAEVIAAAAYNDEITPELAPDGKDTAAVLAALKLEHEEVFDRIEAELRCVVPNVERVRVRRVQNNKRVGHKIFLDLRGAAGIPAHAASDGTLVTLALLTVLFSSSRPRLILLDDLEHALHPEAQLVLVNQLKRLLEEMPELQIVASTHSPYILDELDLSEVQVFALRKDGSAATKRLSEHPQAGGALTTGQLWSLDPERRWVAEED